MSLFQNSVLNKYLKGLESEKVTQAYESYTSHFHNSTIQENIRNSKEEQYQGEFLIDLFVNVLGYTKNPTPDFNLTTELKNIKGSKKTDGAILKGEKALAVIELKGTSTTDLSKVETQAFGYKNNHPGCNYVITSNFEKLRFYIDNAVDFEEFNLFQLSKERFNILWLCLSSKYLLKDIPKKIKDESLTQEENVTKKLYKDYALFRNEIFDAIQKENPEYDKLTLFKKTQKLLDRFLFILFAEDRLLLPPNSIRSIVNQWTDLRDKYDEYFPLYDRFKKYFGYMNIGHKGQQHDIFAYNGGLFAPDEILDNIKINDELLHKHTVNLSNYDFESEVSVNILGHIFEHSLNDIDEIQAEIQGLATEQSKTKRKKDGVFYTPKYITKYIVDNTVGKLCEEKKTELNIQEAEYKKERKGRQKATLKKLSQKLEDYRKWLLQITICDPACGSGAFLNQALEFLITEHQYIDELQAKLFGDTMVLSEVENAILENNLFGVDINEESVEIAKLSLWLRTAQKGRKLTSLNNNIKCGNSLIANPTVAGDKAFHWQNEFPEVFANGGFDVVIGNPPYITFALGAGTKHEDSTIKYLKESFKSANYKVSSYIIFVEQALSLIKGNGILSYIIPNTYHNNFYSKDFRKDLIENFGLHTLLNLKYKVFDDAEMGFTSIPIIYKKPLKRMHLAECNSVEDFYKMEFKIVESSIFSEYPDSKFLFGENINLWRKAKQDCFDLASKEFQFYNGIKTGNNKKYISSSKIDERYLEIITGKDFDRYYTSESVPFVLYDTELLWSNTNKAMYDVNSKLIIRRTGDRIKASLDNKKRFCQDTIHLLFSRSENCMNEYLLALFNSKLMNFLYQIIVPELGKAFAEVKIVNLKKLPVKIIHINKQNRFRKQVNSLMELTYQLKKMSQSVIDLFCNKYCLSKSSRKLQNWHELDFGEFLKELEKAQKKSAKENETEYKKLSLSEEAEWMQYFNEQKQKAQELKTEIDKTEREIDQMVYELYGLTDEEIAIVEEASA